MNAVCFKIVLFCGLCFFGNGQESETTVLVQIQSQEATTTPSNDDSTNLSEIKNAVESSSASSSKNFNIITDTRETPLIIEATTVSSEISNNTDTQETPLIIKTTTVSSEISNNTDTQETPLIIETTTVSNEISIITESQKIPSIKERTSGFSDFFNKNAEIQETVLIETTTVSLPCVSVPEIDNLSVSEGSHNVTATWEIPETDCTINGFNINVFLNNKLKNSFIVNETSIVLSNLEACADYSIEVSIISENLNGSAVVKTFTTREPESEFKGVEDFDISQVNDMLNVTWSPPLLIERCISSYYLTAWDAFDVEHNSLISESIPAPTTFYSFSSISCMNYTFQIIPKIQESDGNNLLRNFQALPKPPNAPEPLPKLQNVSKRNAFLRWQTDDNKITVCPLNEILLVCEAKLDDNEDLSWIKTPRNSSLHINIENATSDFRYTTKIEDLSPWTNYTCRATAKNDNGSSAPAEIQITTESDVPSAPEPVYITNITSYNFMVQWTKPDVIPGIMQSYFITIESAPAEETIKSQGCPDLSSSLNNQAVDFTTTYYYFDKVLPYYHYNVTVYAADDAGNSQNAYASSTSLQAEPSKVTNVDLNPVIWNLETNLSNPTTSLTINFSPPCNINGKFKQYEIHFTGSRKEYDVDYRVQNETTMAVLQSVTLDLLPDRSYEFHISVVTEFHNTTFHVGSIDTKPGVPDIVGNFTPPVAIDSEKANFTFSKDDFDDENGDILYYALIISNNKKQSQNYGLYECWPELTNDSIEITEKKWNPFNENNTVSFIIGAANTELNVKLSENTEYSLIVRAITKATYKDSNLLYFKTNALSDSKLGLILGLTFGLLAALVLIIFIAVLWRRHQRVQDVFFRFKRFERFKPTVDLQNYPRIAAIYNRLFNKHSDNEEIEKKISHILPETISHKKFPAYYATLQENYNILKAQYTALGLQGKELAGTITYAVLPENRRKNRYTNILPYDETRVKLNIEEDDEISSDYINASYIKGYSGKVEYIATQGPLESTTRDFWKMIIQEHVTVIVMVSEFVEQNKEKCHQYFPNNHRSELFYDIEISCTTELHFGTYCIRTLQAKKDNETHNVVHMQFLEWPDFGVPQGTDNMLQFCQQMRERITSEKDLIVVHCSAGVGRTGTLITLDILLQTIDDHRGINIYKSVFDLRKQRTNMVQTEKQYMFIHTCVLDYLQIPNLEEKPPKEEIYENVEVLGVSIQKNSSETELESPL